MPSFRTTSDYFKEVFGGKIRKIAIDAGFSCPNRDGTKGTGGCIFCNNDAFRPSYCTGSITSQIEKGMIFNESKGPVCGYLAYFQSYSGTFAGTEELIEKYEEALSVPGVLGLVIATRPDCLSDDLLDYFRCRFGFGAPSGHPYLLVELGMESTEDSTLEMINRGHGYDCSVQAVNSLDRIGIPTGAHIILGLPGENAVHYEKHIRRLSELPIATLKLHQLQIIKGTELARIYMDNPGLIKLFTAEEYAETVARLIPILRPDIALDRFVSETPPGLLIAPRWGIKPSVFSGMVDRLLTTI